MSEIFRFEVPHSVIPRYTVERHAGFTLIFGAMPVSDFGMFAAAAGERSVVSGDLADRYGASFAFGDPDAVEGAIAAARPRAIDRRLADELGLSAGAREWLGRGRHGLSSKCMFSQLTGYPLGDDQDAPDDAGALYRCRLLLDAAPELGERIAEMSSVSPVWARIAGAWSELCRTMDEEAPDWRAGTFTAPRTNSLLRELHQGSAA